MNFFVYKNQGEKNVDRNGIDIDIDVFIKRLSILKQMRSSLSTSINRPGQPPDKQKDNNEALGRVDGVVKTLTEFINRLGVETPGPGFYKSKLAAAKASDKATQEQQSEPSNDTTNPFGNKLL